MAALIERYIAAMVLSGVGDAMGYKNGHWEFCHSGTLIHQEAESLGGINKLQIKPPAWIVSDDTVMHLATAEAYTEIKDKSDKASLYKRIAEKYKECMHDMHGRSPGPTTMDSCHKLKPLRSKGYQIPFDPRGGGCGAAMRAMCIGLQYPKPESLNDLIADSIESGRMTHHHPTGFLGSLTAALFTSYAIQNKPVKEWGAGLMKTLNIAHDYIKRSGHEVKKNLESWDYFENAWADYLKLRNITSGETDPVFPENFDVEERDKFYKSLSFSGWGGASGHDAPMIAYDATLGSGDSWIEICKRGILHSGDNDSTGVMAGCWFGARHGLKGVPDNHHKELEYRKRLENAAIELFKSSGLDDSQKESTGANTADSNTMNYLQSNDNIIQNSQSCTVLGKNGDVSKHSSQQADISNIEDIKEKPNKELSTETEPTSQTTPESSQLMENEDEKRTEKITDV